MAWAKRRSQRYGFGKTTLFYRSKNFRFPIVFYLLFLGKPDRDMIELLKFGSFCLVVLFLASCKPKADQRPTMKSVLTSEDYKEAYRPQYHFSPQDKWMNDPNGLVYHQGIYHLFYQYYPDDIVWGPMHWGHATSTDMLHWTHKPIALFPDKHGYIFSGSAVVDRNNTSGLGTADTPPLVAVFTYHDAEGEKEGRTDFQTQGIAYSLDNGDTWTKHEGNPVIGNEGIKDFRDPKVFWNHIAEQWTMLLVAGDHLQIWNSHDLIRWKKESEFGKEQGAHGGVWECPDLFPLTVEGTDMEKWVLLISINPGAPNGGSGTQYFIGDFDGTTFSSDQKEDRWLDWGTDNYAGVTYNHAPKGDRIFIGWMSNWDYARDTPTERWRSAMTVPRNLSLKQTGKEYSLFNYPLKNFDTLIQKSPRREITLTANESERILSENFNQTAIRFTTTARDFELSFKNKLNEHLRLTMDGDRKMFSLDRTQSGKTDFKEEFGNKVHQMPIESLPDGPYEVMILLDWSSVEVFINQGQYVMTAQLFPSEPYEILEVENTSAKAMDFIDFEISGIKSIW